MVSEWLKSYLRGGEDIDDNAGVTDGLPVWRGFWEYPHDLLHSILDFYECTLLISANAFIGQGRKAFTASITPLM